jgi:MFS family permease
VNRDLFKIKGYLPLILAQIISNLGDWMDILAIMALVGIKWQASAFAVSGIALSLALPSIFFGTFAGVLADRMDRKMVMILTDLLRIGTVIGIVLSTELWQVFLFICLKSLLSTLFQPAKEGMLKDLVKTDLIQSAVATSELINNGAKIVGPIISGVIVASFSIDWAFYLDALSFLISALLLVGLPKTVRSSETKTKTKQKKSMIHQFTDGFVFIKQLPALILGLFAFSLVLLVLQIADSQIIVLLREIPHDSVNILGILMAASGVGVIIASIILNKKEVKSFLFTIALSSAGVGLTYFLAGAFIHISVFWIAVCYTLGGLFGGFSFGMALISFNVMAQKLTPSEFTGRVFGTINSVANLAVVIGMFGGGIISEVFGVEFTYMLSGGLLVFVGVIVFCFRNKGRQIEPAKSLSKELA